MGTLAADPTLDEREICAMVYDFSDSVEVVVSILVQMATFLSFKVVEEAFNVRTPGKAVLLFSKLNHYFFYYFFDPENINIDSEIK